MIVAWLSRQSARRVRRGWRSVDCENVEDGTRRPEQSLEDILRRCCNCDLDAAEACSLASVPGRARVAQAHRAPIEVLKESSVSCIGDGPPLGVATLPATELRCAISRLMALERQSRTWYVLALCGIGTAPWEFLCSSQGSRNSDSRPSEKAASTQSNPGGVTGSSRTTAERVGRPYV